MRDFGITEQKENAILHNQDWRKICLAHKIVDYCGDFD
jgi:hypothetical protein